MVSNPSDIRLNAQLIAQSIAIRAIILHLPDAIRGDVLAYIRNPATTEVFLSEAQGSGAMADTESVILFYDELLYAINALLVGIE